MFLLEFLLFLSVTVHLSAASCLQFISTAKTSGANYTVEGVVNREQFVSYDDNIGKIIPEWMLKIISDEPDHWSRLNRRLKHDLQSISKDVNTASPNLINTEGNHTVQEKFGCEQYYNRTERRFWKFGYDDEVLISLNLNDGVWTAETRPAEFNMQQWDQTDTARFRTAFLLDECNDWLKKYLDYKRAAGSQSDSGLTQNNWCEPERKTIPPPTDAGNGHSVPGIIAAGLMVPIVLVAGVGVIIWKKKKEMESDFTSVPVVTKMKPGKDSLQFISTANTPGTDFTVKGLLNGEQFVSYDSNNDELIPKTDWMEKIKYKYPGRWGALTERLKHDLKRVSEDVNTASPNLINTEGNHTVQEKFGCEQYYNGTERGFWKFVYDDKDLISLNLNDEVWTAETPDEFKIEQWEKTDTAVFRRFFLKNQCMDWLQTCMEYRERAAEAERVSLNPHPDDSSKIFPPPDFEPSAD